MKHTMKPQFEKHEDQLFRMLEEHEIVPLKENDANVLVRFITHGVIGEYVMEHWLDCNQKNVPIYVEDVDSDGDVTVWIDENRNEHHCCPFPMFEIIGTLVKEGSAEWGEYQTQQGVVVRHKDGCVVRPEYDSSSRAAIFEHYPTGWQIYEEPEQPKPLLADAKVGDLCQRRDGKWVQIDRLVSIGGLPWICYEIGGLRYINNGEQLNSKLSELGIIHTEPLAPEGTADWAWQMLMLGIPVSHPAEGEFQDTYYTKGGFVRCMAKTGWQIYHEPKPEQPNPEPTFKVGDWVEFIDVGGRTSQGKYLSKAYDHAILVLDINSNMRCVVPTTKIIRKLSPSEVIVKIGCLSGTIKRWDSSTFHIFHGNSKFSKIHIDALDTQTRELVESLLEAMRGES